MPLDVWIHGAGYGETIVLAWHEEGRKRRRAAVIDSFGSPSRPEQCFALKKLGELDDPVMAFVCATHPHFDHTATLPLVIETHVRRLQRVYWWGGHHRSVVGDMLGALQPGQRPSVRTLMHLMALIRNVAGDSRPGETVLAQEAAFTGIHHVYSAVLPETEGDLNIWSISPFLGPQKRFRESFEACISKEGEVGALKLSAANDTSLAFLVQYGRSQMILGGDIGVENWRQAVKEWERRQEELALPEFNPDVIKVSHHGSKTAVTELQKRRPPDDPDMWPSGGGFFGTMRQREEPPTAVITPWTGAATRSLPVPDVVQRIQASGFHVHVTGCKVTGDPICAGVPLEFEDSHVRVTLSAAGGAPEVVAHRCESHPPLQSVDLSLLAQPSPVPEMAGEGG